ncbi:MAG TPA: 2-dehydropantoate 2-reductase [Terriglobales bacterium]|nr:2-dehydropantoate 2-reductase [Terriglobales bacterium]
MQHGILGAGGVGGLIAAVLAGAGDPVTLIVRPQAVDGYPRVLSLESRFGNLSVPVSVSAAVTRPFDLLWITVKATQLEAALESVPAPAQIGAVVPLLNGVEHVALLRRRFGDERVVPATIAVESERVAPGRIVHRSPFVRLNVAASGRPRLEASVEHLRRFGFECRFVESESTLLWSKLVFLAPIALSCTAAALPIDLVVADPAARGRLEASVREACAVAAAAGATVDAAAVIAGIAGLPPGMRASMQKDVEAGRTPELDAIAGPILRGAQAHGLPATATQELVAAVRRRMTANP